MKIWTGKFFLILPFVLTGLSCSSGDSKKGAEKADVPPVVSLQSDREELAELRKEVPEETKRSNDRLAEMLTRWKAVKMPPETLREKFSDEIRKVRETNEKTWRRAREDFSRRQTDNRKTFQDKQKEERDDFYGMKPTSDRRSDFTNRQGEDRERFNSDQRDSRDQFEDLIKDQRKTFEEDVANRWSEFRQEFPEYSRLYREMKADEEKKKEEAAQNPKPYAGWPYKMPGEPDATPGAQPSRPPKPEAVDVNKGGEGWPSTDPSEFNH